MRRIKRQLAVVIVICMAFTLMMPLPAFAVEKPAVEVDFVDTQKTITIGSISYPVLKMVVSAGSTSGIKTFNTIFSMDSNTIKPVRGVAGGTYEILDIVDGSTEKRCFSVKGIYDESYDPNEDITTYTKYTASPGKGWVTSGTTMAFDYGLYAPVNDADLNPSYFGIQPMFEFYFTVVSNPYKGCIKIEVDTEDGSLISQLYSNPAERGGIYIKSGGVDYFYTSANTASIDYDISYPANMGDKVASIDITTPPTKISYVEGQAFDPAGMVVTATYADDTTAVIPSGEYEPTGQLATSDTAITVTYTDPFDGTEYTDTQSITVAAKVIESISVQFNPGGATIYTSVDPDDLALKQMFTVTATFNDNSTGILDPSRYELSDSFEGDSESGDRTITVTSAGGKTATVTVPVTKVEVSSIDAVFDQGATPVYTSSTLDSLKSMLTVAGTNNDGTSAGNVTADCTLGVDGGKLVEGTNTITVTHTPSGSTDTFTVNVTAVAVTGISVNTGPTKTNYTAFDTFDPAGMNINVVYNDGTNEDMNVTADMISYATSGADSLRFGDTSVTVNYGGKTATITGLTVTKKQIVKPTVTNGPLTYNGNSQSPTIATDEAYTISGNSKTDAGSYKATVALDDTDNYEWVDSPTANLSLDWSIGVKTLTVENGTYAVSKPYDGTKTAGVATGALALNGVIGSDDVSVDVSTPLPAYSGAGVGTYTLSLSVSISGAKKENYVLDSGTYSFTNAKIEKAIITKPIVTGTLTYNGSAQSPAIATNAAYTISGNSGANADDYTAIVTLNDTANYQWSDSTDASFNLSWSIARADYTVTVDGTKDVKIGSGLAALPTETTAGVNSETPAGTLTWYSNDARTTVLTDAALGQLDLGAHNIYWSFTTSDGNYIATPKTVQQ